MKYALLFVFIIVQATACHVPHSPATVLYASPHNWFIQKIMATRACALLEGAWCDTHIPHWTHYSIAQFIQKNNIDLSEAMEEKIANYRTFNDFFTRALKPHVRPIADAENNATITSPADGHMLVVEHIDQETPFFVKNKPFNLKTFLNSAHMAQEFEQGTLIIIYLSPADYHRFHMPCAGYYIQEQIVHGAYDSVYPGIFAYVEPLSHNERHILTIKSVTGHTCICAPIGAMLVGKITYTAPEHIELAKGSELGYFSFGGSTIVLLFKKDECILDDTWNKSRLPKNILPLGKINAQRFMHYWTPIKMGQRLATFMLPQSLPPLNAR